MNVLVLGAGVIGVTSAWYLAEAGHDVTVLERHGEPAMETSFANGGQICAAYAEPWAKPSVLPNILRWLGREDAPMLFRWRMDPAQWRWGLGFLAECAPGRFERNVLRLAALAHFSQAQLIALRERTAIEYECLQRGILHFCTAPRAFDALARHAEAMQRLGFAREVLSAADCIALEPALADSRAPVAGGVYTPTDESGDAHLFTQRLAEHAAAHGVVFRFGTEIQGLEAQGMRVDGVRLASGERIAADATVVALGSYSTRVLSALGLRLPLYPLKGYSITVPLKANVANEGNGSPAPRVSLTDEAHKIVITRLGDRLRAAGTAELAGYDTTVNAVRCDAIAARIRTLFPALDVGGDLSYWAGLRPATPSNVPLVGATRCENLFLNTGHGTLGWTLACGSGRALADLISGRPPGVALGPVAAV